MTENEAIEEFKQRLELIEKCYRGEVEDYKQALEIGVKALEKQIPKKPIEYEDKFYACPICRNVLLHKWEKYNTELMDKSNGLPYCLCCGQKLDWSDEE